MTFVGAFHSGATSVLAGALLRRPAPRPHVHTVTIRQADTRNVERLLAALEVERARAARLEVENGELRAQLAMADELLGV